MKYVYRIVNALLAAAIFPVVIFIDLISFQLSTSLADVGLEESISIKFIIDVITGKESMWHNLIFDEGESLSFSWPAALDPIKGRLIAVAVCFVLILLIAIFIIVWSACSNKRIPVLSASVAGLISVIVMTICFNSAASVLMDGTINIVEIFSSNWIISLLGNLVLVDYLGLGGFHNVVLFLFIGLIVWSLSFYLIEIGEPKEEKKAKSKK